MGPLTLPHPDLAVGRPFFFSDSAQGPAAALRPGVQLLCLAKDMTLNALLALVFLLPPSSAMTLEP